MDMRRLQSGMKWIIRVAVAALFIVGLGPAAPRVPVAQAQSQIGMTSVVGFSGYYRRSEWIPVYVTIHNDGPAVRADLTVDVGTLDVGSGHVGVGNLHWPIRLPSHGWVHEYVSVPGSLLPENPSLECLVNGQAVAATYLSGNEFRHLALVAVLFPDGQTQPAQFLTGSTDGQTGDPVLPVSVSTLATPESAQLFNDVTAIVADPDALQHLSAVQQRALLTWVRLGGQLVVIGTEGMDGVWRTVLPLQPGSAQSISGDALTAFVGTDAVKSPRVWMTAAGLRAGGVLLAGTPTLPMVAAAAVGRGTLVQTAFTPSQPALLAWPENAALWTAVLQAGQSQNEAALPSLLDPQGALTLTVGSNALSPLRVPSLKFWASVFGLYTLLVGPVVFAILRRRKREQWAWLLLPALSVATTFGIYSFGASQRPSGILTEGLGVMDLLGQGQAEAYGIRSFMAPFVASALATTQGPMLVLPLAAQSGPQMGEATVVNDTRSTVSFASIPRWGVRYIYAAGDVSGQGQLHTDLWGSVSGLLVGKVRNDTRYSLQNVALFWNGAMLPLGDLAAGATTSVHVQVSAQTGTANWLAAYSNYNRTIAHGVGRPLGSLASTLGLLSVNLNAKTALVVATTVGGETPALPSLVSSRHTIASDQTLVLVRQFTSVRRLPLEVQTR